jgi:uncharacterized protein (DUF433 family)
MEPFDGSESEKDVTKTVTIRLKESQMERLRGMARHLGRTPAETSAILVEEALRRSEFAHIDFRNSPAGRQAYLQGSGLAVWEVVWLARYYQMDADETARHLDCPAYRVQAALDYATAFPEEIDPVLEEQASMDFESLSRLLPEATCFVTGTDTALAPVPASLAGENQA